MIAALYDLSIGLMSVAIVAFVLWSVERKDRNL